MQVPTRRSDLRPRAKSDPNITQEKFEKLKVQLNKYLKEVRPELAREVKRLAEDGDFSENFPYQVAKGKLRGLNNKILKIEDLLKRAEIIEVSKNTRVVQLGHSVTIETKGKKKTYQILGSGETDPEKGVISHNSPLGMALLGEKVGNMVRIKEREYKIIKIS